jgi:hypothetical protein
MTLATITPLSLAHSLIFSHTFPQVCRLLNSILQSPLFISSSRELTTYSRCLARFSTSHLHMPHPWLLRMYIHLRILAGRSRYLTSCGRKLGDGLYTCQLTRVECVHETRGRSGYRRLLFLGPVPVVLSLELNQFLLISQTLITMA